MDIIEELQKQIDKVWEPVLCPVRTSVSNELLGGEFVSVSEEALYKRHDDHITTIDGYKLIFTTYLKVNDQLRANISMRSSHAPHDSEISIDQFDTMESSAVKCKFFLTKLFFI
jgi:hypothetical protein